MNVNIETVWMSHEGGTKFYQIFQLTPQGCGRSVTLNHYGPVKGHDHRPVNGGQTQIKPGRLLNATVIAKKKRGYTDEDTQVQNRQDNDYWFKSTFGAALAHDLHVAMFADTIAAERAPRVEPDNEVIPGAKAPPETRPENWGTW